MSDRIDFGGEPWQAIPRRTLRDSRLSARAKGGLVTLLSHEEGWVRSCIAILMAECAIGRKQAQAIMAELRVAGYAEMVREKGDDNLVKTHYVVFAVPQGAGSQADLFTSPTYRKPGGSETGRVGNGAAVVDPQDVDPLDEEEALEHPERVPRARNPLFDALAEACGTDPTAMTPREARACGVALAEIQKAMPDVNPEELRRRATNYRTHFPGGMTPNALAGHWGQSDKPSHGRGQVAVPGLRDHEEAQRLRAEGR